MALPIIGSIVSIVEKVIDKALPDPQAKAAAILELKKLEMSGDLAVITNQSEINKLDAVSQDRFQSRWRPFIGWVCGLALASQLILFPMVEYVSALAGHPTKPPVLETELLTGMVISMLGIGGMRSFDKQSMKGVK